MAKTRPNSMIKFLCLCLILNSFSLILSDEVEYNPNTRSAESKVDKAISDKVFTLKFNYQEDKPAYVKITLTPNQGQLTPNMCYSPTDTNCEKNRVVHATRADKSPVIACVRKTEISGSSEKKLNVKVSCRTPECGYIIKFEGNDRCRLDAEKGSVYSYVVTSDNRDLDFEVFGKSKLETYMQIGLEGSTTAKIKIPGNHLNPKNMTYDGAQFYSYQINIDSNETQSIGEFSVEDATVGDLIRLTVYTMYDSKGPDNLLYPGGSAVMGFVSVNEHFMPELCLPVSAFGTGEFAEMSKFYLTGKIYSQYALFWPANERGEYVEDIEQEINDGLLAYMLEPKGKKSSICFEYSYVEQVMHRDVVFSVQIIPMATKNTNNFYFMPPPMTVGQSYRHIIQKGKTFAYSSAKIDMNKNRFSLNVYKRKGEIRVLTTDCNTYPKCEYNMDDGGDEVLAMESIPFVGKISLYDRKIERTQDPLDKQKKVFVITCLDDGNDEKGYCEFDTYFYYQDQTITLVNGENMAKYVERGKEGEFKVFFNGALKLEAVGVEIMVHNGEILFEGKQYDEYHLGEFATVNKYLLSNKVFLYYQMYRESFEYIYVKYKAIKDSFFTIKYLYNKAGTTQQFKEEIIYPGESYLVEMEPTADYNKTVQVINDKNKDGNGFVTNFFSLNCDFQVFTTRDLGKSEEVALADGYGQDILSKDSGSIYKEELYNYTISIETPEKSNYNDKMCMIYVAGTKIDDAILIGNNVNQQFIFEDNFKVIKFVYPLADFTKDLVVYANIIDKAYYNIAIAVDNAKHTFFNEKITKSTPFYIKSSDFNGNCNKNTFCNILIVVEMVKNIDYLPKTNPMIEITVREATQKGTYEDLRVPTYLQKGIAKKDFTTGDGYYYLYTNLGVSDEGDITINFYRDYGEVYGRIVKKDIRDSEGEKEIEWMDLYRLPGKEWKTDDQNYNKYLKKFHIDIEDTVDCINGCYLILGIIISQIGEYAEDWKFYPFSIMTQISQSTFGEAAEVPIITIQVDEFIIGNVDIAKNVRINQYYQVWLPRDSYQVQFDWQSDLAGLYVNVDGTLPTATNADFILRPNNTDSILTIDQQPIIKYFESRGMKLPVKDSIEDVRLIIGVWTDKTDSADTELYSLRVHEASLDPKEYTFFDIIEVNTDQKILCKPYIIGENRYQCLFMIIYDRQDLEFGQDLLVYARSNNRGDSTEMYGSFIDNNIYDDFMIDNLKASIPNYEKSDYNSVKQDTSYFHVKLNSEEMHKNRYLYVSVISRYQDDIMMVASINTFDVEEKTNYQIFNPSPRTEQLVQVKEDILIVKFMANTSLIVNIENLGGEADVRWEEDDKVVHNLRGRGDRLTLTSSTNYKRIIFKKLKSDQQQRGQDPGFVFIMDYYARSASKNFDEVVYGNSIEIGYRDTDLPIFLYSKAVDYTNDIALAVTFRDSHIDTSGEYPESPIFVKAFLDKRDSVYAAKQLPIFEPSEINKIDGIYDLSIKTAQVFMPDYMMNSYMRIDPEEYPTLLLYVGKNPAYKDKQYKTFNVEAQFNRINSLVVPVEKIYNYAKFEGLKTHYYKLKTHRVKKIMKIVLSFNSEELSWAIGDKQSAHSNITSKYQIEASKRNGKILATVQAISGVEPLDFLYLNIWKTKPDQDENFQLQNYVFKYINIEKESEFFDYEIYGDKPDLTINENKNGDKTTITCKFNRINLASNDANVTYFLKIADAKNYIDKENFETIAVTETPYYTKYERNPQSQSNQVTLSATGDFSNWGYIQVIAQIQQNKVLEYIAYKGVKMQRANPDDNPGGNGGSSTGLFVGISVTLVILIAGLVVLVIYFQRRNKSLVNQVKHVSFQQAPSAASDPDLLLAKK